MVIYNGEECWTTEEIMEDLYIYAGGDLRRFVRQGMPCIVLGNGRRLFPKERIHAWFRGDTGAKKKRSDKNLILLSWGKIESLIGAQGFTPYGFAKEGKVCSGAIKRIRRGKVVRLSTAQKFAEALGVDVEELLE